MPYQARFNRVFLVAKLAAEFSLLVVNSLLMGLDVALVHEKLSTNVATMLKRIEYVAKNINTNLLTL